MKTKPIELNNTIENKNKEIEILNKKIKTDAEYAHSTRERLQAASGEKDRTIDKLIAAMTPKAPTINYERFGNGAIGRVSSAHMLYPGQIVRLDFKGDVVPA